MSYLPLQHSVSGISLLSPIPTASVAPSLPVLSRSGGGSSSRGPREAPTSSHWGGWSGSRSPGRRPCRRRAPASSCLPRTSHRRRHPTPNITATPPHRAELPPGASDPATRPSDLPPEAVSITSEPGNRRACRRGAAASQLQSDSDVLRHRDLADLTPASLPMRSKGTRRGRWSSSDRRSNGSAE
jgi:hypothetical protein